MSIFSVHTVFALREPLRAILAGWCEEGFAGQLCVLRKTHSLSLPPLRNTLSPSLPPVANFALVPESPPPRSLSEMPFPKGTHFGKLTRGLLDTTSQASVQPGTSHVFRKGPARNNSQVPHALRQNTACDARSDCHLYLQVSLIVGAFGSCFPASRSLALCARTTAHAYAHQNHLHTRMHTRSAMRISKPWPCEATIMFSEALNLINASSSRPVTATDRLYLVPIRAKPAASGLIPEPETVYQRDVYYSDSKLDERKVGRWSRGRRRLYVQRCRRRGRNYYFFFLRAFSRS